MTIKKELKFIHISKTAGASITIDAKRQGICWGTFHSEYGYCHDYFSDKSQALKDKYDWFMVVRNPYDRVISEYYYLTQVGRDKRIDTPEELNQVCKTWMTAVKENRQLPYSLARLTGDHFSPQWRYYDSSATIHILKFETLQEDFYRLMEHYGLNIKLKSHTHKSRPKKFTVSDFETETIQLIHELYRKDFEMFGYEMIQTEGI